MFHAAPCEDPMKRILILFAHPSPKKSRVNEALRASVQDLDNVNIHDLYSEYPDMLVNPRHEQRVCEEHDVIVMQYPVYWYSTPAVLKEWQDSVLQLGWAYGSGRALEDKLFFAALSAGGEEHDYRTGRYRNFSLRDLTAPLRAMAETCGMEWLPPFAVMGVHKGLSKEALTAHAEDYRRVLLAIRDGRIDTESALRQDRLNENLNTLIRSS